MNRSRRYRGFLIDIEGVLVRDKRYEPIAGSIAWFHGLAERGLAHCLVSNNTTHRPEDLVRDLGDAGFEVDGEHLVGVLELAVARLHATGRRKILWLGAPSLAGWWRQRGFELTRDEPCGAVVLGVNPELEVPDLDRALPQLHDHGADLLCLHRNRFWLDASGRARLGPGAWAAALELVTRAGSVETIGKPAEPIYRAALERLGVPAEECLFVSDDPAADLVTAKRLGMGTAFVLCGKYTDHSILGELDQEDWPDLVCASPADLAAELAG